MGAVLLNCLQKVKNKEIVVDFDQDSKNTVFETSDLMQAINNIFKSKNINICVDK
ncbi:hypothetical protein QIA01_05485 (plasmid) [Borreliella americana]